jgi:hypothetical protein
LGLCIFYGLVYTHYYWDKLKYYIDKSKWKPSTEIPLILNHDFLESDLGEEDAIIKEFKSKIRRGGRISQICFIITVLMTVVFIPIELGWLG